MAKHVTITGMEAISRKLAQVTGPAGKKVIRQAMRAELKPILEDAKANAPVKSGLTRRSIKIKAGRTKRGIRIKIVIGTGNYIGKSYYGAFPEKGTHGPRAQKAQHFMMRAYERHAQTAKDGVIARILSGIDAIVASDGTGGKALG